MTTFIQAFCNPTAIPKEILDRLEEGETETKKSKKEPDFPLKQYPIRGRKQPSLAKMFQSVEPRLTPVLPTVTVSTTSDLPFKFPNNKSKVSESTGFMDAISHKSIGKRIKRKHSGSNESKEKIAATSPVSEPNILSPSSSLSVERRQSLGIGGVSPKHLSSSSPRHPSSSPQHLSSSSSMGKSPHLSPLHKPQMSPLYKHRPSPSYKSDISPSQLNNHIISRMSDGIDLSTSVTGSTNKTTENSVSANSPNVEDASGRKKVHWAAGTKLYEIHYFEQDEFERVNVTKLTPEELKKEGISMKMYAAKHASSIFLQEDSQDSRIINMWRRPPKIHENSLPSYQFTDGQKSVEKNVQKARERTVLAALYLSKSSIPNSPAEPEIEGYTREEPKIIPIDIIDPSNPDSSVTSTSSLKDPGYLTSSLISSTSTSDEYDPANPSDFSFFDGKNKLKKFQNDNDDFTNREKELSGQGNNTAPRSNRISLPDNVAKLLTEISKNEPEMDSVIAQVQKKLASKTNKTEEYEKLNAIKKETIDASTTESVDKKDENSSKDPSASPANSDTLMEDVSPVVEDNDRKIDDECTKSNQLERKGKRNDVEEMHSKHTTKDVDNDVINANKEVVSTKRKTPTPPNNLEKKSAPHLTLTKEETVVVSASASSMATNNEHLPPPLSTFSALQPSLGPGPIDLRTGTPMIPPSISAAGPPPMVMTPMGPMPVPNFPPPGFGVPAMPPVLGGTTIPRFPAMPPRFPRSRGPPPDFIYTLRPPPAGLPPLGKGIPTSEANDITKNEQSAKLDTAATSIANDNSVNQNTVDDAAEGITPSTENQPVSRPALLATPSMPPLGAKRTKSPLLSQPESVDFTKNTDPSFATYGPSPPPNLKKTKSADGHQKICHFFNTPTGCRLRNKCKFKHVTPSSKNEEKISDSLPVGNLHQQQRNTEKNTKIFAARENFGSESIAEGRDVRQMGSDRHEENGDSFFDNKSSAFPGSREELYKSSQMSEHAMKSLESPTASATVKGKREPLLATPTESRSSISSGEGHSSSYDRTRDHGESKDSTRRRSPGRNDNRSPGRYRLSPPRRHYAPRRRSPHRGPPRMMDQRRYLGNDRYGGGGSRDYRYRDRRTSYSRDYPRPHPSRTSRLYRRHRYEDERRYSRHSRRSRSPRGSYSSDSSRSSSYSSRSSRSRSRSDSSSRDRRRSRSRDHHRETSRSSNDRRSVSRDRHRESSRSPNDRRSVSREKNDISSSSDEENDDRESRSSHSENEQKT